MLFLLWLSECWLGKMGYKTEKICLSLSLSRPIAHSQRCFGGEAATTENPEALPTNAASWLANNISNNKAADWKVI